MCFTIVFLLVKQTSEILKENYLLALRHQFLSAFPYVSVVALALISVKQLMATCDLQTVFALLCF